MNNTIFTGSNTFVRYVLQTFPPKNGSNYSVGCGCRIHLFFQFTTFPKIDCIWMDYYALSIAFLTNLIPPAEGAAVSSSSEVAEESELNGLCHLFCFRSKTKDVLLLSSSGVS